MKAKRPEPVLRTPENQYNKVEKFKLSSNMIRDDLATKFRDMAELGIDEEAEQLAKSHGIYLEYNRAKTGKEKDWMYMIRLSVPAGGSFDAKRWQILDDVAGRYTVNPEGNPSLRLTTRQNVQFHWVKKEDLVPLVRDIAKTGYLALNGCGDNTRNVMGCPLSKFSDLYNSFVQAQKYGEYFELPNDPHIEIFEVDTSYERFAAEMQNDPVASKSCGGAVRATGRFDYQPNLLNRKFKLGFSAVHRNPETGELDYDNCPEIRTQDIGIAPVMQGPKGGEELAGFQVYIGGGQGEKNGKPTFAGLGQPLGVFAPENLFHGLDALVHTHAEWGDRKNRHWARLKYVVHEQGIEWFQEQIKGRGAAFENPDPSFDPGPRMLHHGWHTLPTNGDGDPTSGGNLAYGAWIDNGRIIDRDPDNQDKHGSGSTPGNGEKLRSMVRHLLETYDAELMITPNQDALFTGIDPAAKEDFEADLKKFGHGERNGKAYSSLRVLSGACVGLHTCRLSYTESEQFAPELIDKLDEMGYGDTAESIGITGCERQCFRPGTKSIGWVGQGPDMYGLKLGGSEDGRHQGNWIVKDEQWWLRRVGREDVPKVCAALIDHWHANKHDGEDLGAFYRRFGVSATLDMLRAKEELTHLFEKALPEPYLAAPEMSK